MTDEVNLESPLLLAVRKEFGRMRNGRILRMNTGGAQTESGRVIKFGVPGYPDMAGILGGPDICPHCGEEVRPQRGQWIGLETKRPKNSRESEAQLNFHRMINGYGGRVAFVRSIEEAREYMRLWGAQW